MQISTRSVMLRATSSARPRPYAQALRAKAVRCQVTFKETAPRLVKEMGELTQFPDAPGVYAVYDAAGSVQFIGLTRKLAASISTHMQELPDLTFAVKASEVASGTREELTTRWKAWVEEAMEESGNIPPGNMPGETKWQSRSVARATKAEIRLTNGKAINVPIEKILDMVVKDSKIVAFIKGTRQQPQCGFSHKMLTLLNQSKADFEVVNVLDEVHNPGLRDAIKNYSQWPTIPQLYIKGEFVGGADIAETMFNSGDLQTAVRSAMSQ